MKIIAVAEQKVGRLRGIFKPKETKSILTKLPKVEKPIVANLKSYYSSFEQKMNDIYLDKVEHKQLTTAIEHNIREYESLPDSIKKCLKPSDIDRYGHVDQNKINDLWEAAKKADKIGVYGRPPVFRGDFVNELETTAKYPEITAMAVDSVEPPEFELKLPELEIENIIGETIASSAENADEAATLIEKVLENHDGDGDVLGEILDALG